MKKIQTKPPLDTKPPPDADKITIKNMAKMFGFR